VTPKSLLTASGASVLKVFDTTNQSFSESQAIVDAHRSGCHHICTSADSKVAASAAFDGEIKIWHMGETSGQWVLHTTIENDAAKGVSMWAIALNAAGQYLVATTTDGKVAVWDVVTKDTPPKMIRYYETGSAGNGTLGMAVDLSKDGLWTASGHQNGTVYVFNNQTTRLVYSLTGKYCPICLFFLIFGSY